MKPTMTCAAETRIMLPPYYGQISDMPGDACGSGSLSLFRRGLCRRAIKDSLVTLPAWLAGVSGSPDFSCVSG